jgi:hypothetical protein
MCSEDFLHYVWQQKAYDIRHVQLMDGTPIEIIDVGTPNFDAGPDFFNAKVRIGDTLWAGNVEIHIKSSMWYDHKHDSNMAYNNVILHVVATYDTDVFRANGEKIPVFEMHIPDSIIQNYQKLQSSLHWIPCQDYLNRMDALTRIDLLDRMAYERLEAKTSIVETYFVETKGNWEETWYRSLIATWGMALNKTPFQLLAKQLPIKILLKHSSNILQLEALLFGQSGLLQIADSDEYVLQLKKEYAHLKRKYGLIPIASYLWKFARLRPSNFPSIRLAQLAALIHKHGSLLSLIVEDIDLTHFYNIFDVEVSPYWLTHYRLGSNSAIKKKNIGKNMLDLIIINAIAPFLFFYGTEHGRTDMKDISHNIIKNIPAENNRIIRKWAELGIHADNAFDSQALLQLFHFYCNKRKCMYCSWGHKLIQN